MSGIESDVGKIFVGNLPPEIGEAEVEKCFTKFGPVKRIDLKQKKTPSGEVSAFAFITYQDPNDAEDAIKGMHEKTLNGMELRVTTISRDRVSSRGGRGSFRGSRGFRGSEGFRGRGSSRGGYSPRGSYSRGDGGYASRGRGSYSRGSERYPPRYADDYDLPPYSSSRDPYLSPRADPRDRYGPPSEYRSSRDYRSSDYGPSSSSRDYLPRDYFDRPDYIPRSSRDYFERELDHLDRRAYADAYGDPYERRGGYEAYSSRDYESSRADPRLSDPLSRRRAPPPMYERRERPRDESPPPRRAIPSTRDPSGFPPPSKRFRSGSIEADYPSSRAPSRGISQSSRGRGGPQSRRY